MFSQRLAFAIANTVAVLAALYISLSFDLDRPYWSVFSVFIVAAPLSGMVRSKAVYRLTGTLIGAGGALLMIPPLVQSPMLLSLAMGVWVGFWLWLSLLDRTPRSYIPLLAGYTATIVGLSVVNVPETIFDTAISRLEEISLGIVCGAVAHSLFFPRNVATELSAKIAESLQGCARWIAHSLSDPSAAAADVSTSLQLSRTVNELYTLNTHVAYETSDVPYISRRIWILQERLASLLPHLSSAQRAIDELRERKALRTPLATLLSATERWSQSLAGATDVLAEGLTPPFVLRKAAATPVAVQHPARWSQLVERTATTHLLDLTEALEDCRTLARAIRNPYLSLPSHLEDEVHAARRVPLYRDVGLAFLSGATATAAVLLACALWIAGSWPEGGIAAQFAAIGCSLFATFDRPSRMIRAAVIGVIVALPFAALYEFAIFPRIDGFPTLALVLAPVFIGLSFMQTVEKLAGAAMVLAISFAGGLALQETFQANFAVFVNTNLAEIAGLLLAIIIILVFRTIDPRWNALRISRATWRALARMADSDPATAHTRPAQMLDRVGQVALRLQDTEQTPDLRSRIDVMRDLRVGVNLATIVNAEKTLGSVLVPRLRAIRRLVGASYRVRARGGNVGSYSALENAIDVGISELEIRPRTEGSSTALAGLVSLRIDLVPNTTFRAGEPVFT